MTHMYTEPSKRRLDFGKARRQEKSIDQSEDRDDAAKSICHYFGLFIYWLYLSHDSNVDTHWYIYRRL